MNNYRHVIIRYFINQQKIEFSKTLLMEGMSVTDIAMLLNFNTSSYFSTVFKKFTALSPMDYLKKQQDS
ncbi:AraC family transcriptional regulator [Blautia sp. OF03-15BH]|uniref:helix-turn-helix domain-containing protein n=1 Tax=Blautia sp. OF03-15BH TaxID=2292287 RepID=UPI000E533D97|nr:AraC family transcriptional regulator [Blautia sp. OF03-15BH]